MMTRGTLPVVGPWRLLAAGLLFGLAVGASALVRAADAPAATPPLDAAKVEFFETKVRPVLVQRCYSCHSHAAGKIKGGLALDSKSGWETGGDSGPAVVPGKADKSLLIEAVQRKSLEMPPDEKLPAAEVAVLEEWVKSGAIDPRILSSAPDRTDWWSLKPLVRPIVPQVPNVAGKGTVAPHPIDAFVLSALREKRLSPAPEADRRTLIRRLTFDLHGLPPTPDEVDAFVADRDPRAYEKLVDRLLASPRYGERWGRHWLDVVRYGDSRGNEHDGFRDHAWRYRDYVIDAFHRDLPYDRFIREQLAADVFSPDRPDLTAALGFLAAGPDVLSGSENIVRDEFVTQTMTAFASTTVHCARCHNHKFDPITQADYYGLQAILSGVQRRDAPVDLDPAVRAARTKWTGLKATATKKDQPNEKAAAELLTAETDRLVAEWVVLQAEADGQWTVLKTAEATTAAGRTLALRDDGSLLADGAPAEESDTTTVRIAGPLAPFRLLRLEVLPDSKLPAGGPGRGEQGDFSLSEIEFLLIESPPPPKPNDQKANGPEKGIDGAKPPVPATVPAIAPVKPAVPEKSRKLGIKASVADFSTKEDPISRAHDGKEETGWNGGRGRPGVPRVAVFDLGSEIKCPEGTRLEIVLKQKQGKQLLLGRLRFSATVRPFSPYALPPFEATTALRTKPEKRSEADRLVLARHVLPIRCDEELAKLPAGTIFHVVAGKLPHEGGPGAPKSVSILRRGEEGKSLGNAAPGALSAIAALPGRIPDEEARTESGRRAWLANWLADDANPLTWRSAVNRVWHHHFGRGLCDTPSDLGHMGGLPSHSALLDWLACEFRDGGKSFKRLHRTIVTSATYRQAAVPNAQAEQVDVDNRLLWRANRRRLDAESYRDAVLAVAGRLDLTVGGPGTMQFEVKNGFNTTKLANYDAVDWDAPGVARRSVYRFVFRTRPDPFMSAMDYPDASQFVPTRGATISPLQSLMLFNSRFVLHHAEHFARRIADRQASDAAEQIRLAFRLALQRDPTAEETSDFAAYATRHGLPAACRLLFNANEFLFVE